MRIVNVVSFLAAMAILSGCSVMAQSGQNPVDLKRGVADTERAFAKSMADRDHAAFMSFRSS
jgi:hypothetical protein